MSNLTKEEILLKSLKNKHLVIDALYHKWGRGLSKNPHYQICESDLDAMEWLRAGYETLLNRLRETA
tara:strand:- start:432 stop:632 length:201 start_codon:yes stop_codon:yes gene_type:complete